MTEQEEAEICTSLDKLYKETEPYRIMILKAYKDLKKRLEDAGIPDEHARRMAGRTHIITDEVTYDTPAYEFAVRFSVETISEAYFNLIDDFGIEAFLDIMAKNTNFRVVAMQAKKE